MSLVWTTMETTVGTLRLVANGSRLKAVLWAAEAPGRVSLGPMREDRAHPVLVEAERQLHAYFEGRLRIFTLDLDLGGTPFQRRVWQELLRIPFGEQRTYGAMVEALGKPQSARAVGAANGRNPLAIIVPCHRLVGASGALHGFAGGLAAKQALLSHECDAFRASLIASPRRFVPARGFTPASWIDS